MRTSLVVLLAAVAFWRAAIDWQATLGKGYAYRFGTVGSLLGDWWPDGLGGIAGAFVLALPVAPALAAIALGLWITRPQARSRARW